MGNRFSRVKQGGELKTALDNYTQYLSNLDNRDTKRSKGGTYGGPRSPLQKIGIRPFGIDVPAGNYILVNVSEAAFGADGANFDAITDFGTGTGKRFETGTIDAASIEERPIGFSPARVTAFVSGTGNPTYVQSKFTKLYYLKYPGKSYSCPFGRQATAAGDTESRDEQAIYNAVKQAVLNSDDNIKRVSIRDERIVAS